MDAKAITISNEDRDRIHILTLSMITLNAQMLRKTRMVKNSHLESVVELYKGDETGSGQVAVGQLKTVFRDISYEDLAVLKKLSELHSYDVYSLRRLLRELEIDVTDQSGLQLSKQKQDELAGYMKSFTRPLIVKLYGDEGVGLEKPDDLLELFKHSESKHVLHNLKLFAQTLSIQVDEIPKVLADYGDLYMSISYYRELLQSIGPIFGQFNATIDEIRSNRQLQQNQNLIQSCTQVQSKFKSIATDLFKRFKSFDETSDAMWRSGEADAFGAFGQSISGSQTALGSMLCALTVKMNDWQTQFPHANVGGPLKWADYIVNDMRQGLEI